ncbi:hypothetical protein RRG08_049983 [Elysia crispata]|uniref:Uncharacterized protein n=1 Tax=Elysia crispata TaxID=231223 RepID=A0AAE1EDL0_9GAST|nr:hypothetical protein RRG08_049983 [Elysia crispata]
MIRIAAITALEALLPSVLFFALSLCPSLKFKPYFFCVIEPGAAIGDSCEQTALTHNPEEMSNIPFNPVSYHSPPKTLDTNLHRNLAAVSRACQKHFQKHEIGSQRSGSSQQHNNGIILLDYLPQLPCRDAIHFTGRVRRELQSLGDADRLLQVAATCDRLTLEFTQPHGTQSGVVVL